MAKRQKKHGLKAAIHSRIQAIDETFDANIDVDDVSNGKLIARRLFGAWRPFDFTILALVLLLFGIGLSVMMSVDEVTGGANMSKQVSAGIIGIAAMMVIGSLNYRMVNNYLPDFIFFLVLGYNIFLAIKSGNSGGIERGDAFEASELLKAAVIILMAKLMTAFTPIYDNDRRASYVRVLDDGRERYIKIYKTQLWHEKKFFAFFGTASRSSRDKHYGKIKYAKEHGKHIERPKYMLHSVQAKTSILLWGIIIFSAAIVLKQSHLSGAIIIAALGCIMLLYGGYNRKAVVAVIIIAVVVMIFLCLFPEPLSKIPLFKNYMYERVALWREKLTVAEKTARGFESDRTQVEASLRAIASGGLFGRGYGNSVQKYSYLAAGHTDFIFAIVVEELGYVGALGILALFAALIWRMIKIARSTVDKFGSLLVVGVAFQIGLELLLNLAVATDSMPNTGITLPFFSYGRTALIMLFVEIGIVLSVSRNSDVSQRQNKRLFGALHRFNSKDKKNKDGEEVTVQ